MEPDSARLCIRVLVSNPSEDRRLRRNLREAVVHVEDPVSVEQMEGARARGETRTIGDEQNMSERSLIHGRQGRVLSAAADPRPNIEASGEWESASAAPSAFGRHPLPLVLHHPVTTHGRHSVQLPASDSECPRPRVPHSLNSRPLPPWLNAADDAPPAAR
jgi:hypothetical protein